MAARITLYTLTVCFHCTRAKEYLEAREIPHDTINMDFLYGEERNQAMDTLRRLNPAITFPTLVIGNAVIAGFRPDEIEAALQQNGIG